MSIYIDGLSFTYGDKRVLEDISLTIRTGECVGIVGVSGGGKSTLLKLLSGLYATQSGIIEVQGTVNRMKSVKMWPWSCRAYCCFRQALKKISPVDTT